MHPSLFSALVFCSFVFLQFGCPLRLSAQTGGSCPFSFEPEYLGEGNCFRVVLRNSDPQRRPHSVVFTVVDDGVMFAGGLDPSRLTGSLESQSWHFRDYRPLGIGASDTGYFCFVSTVSTARIALTWLDASRNVLCKDTVRLDLPRPNRACVEIRAFDMPCLILAENGTGPDADRAERRSASTWEGVPVYMDLHLSLINRSDGNVRSVDIAGPGCDGRATGLRTENVYDTARPGDTFELFLRPDYPHCFEVDSAIGWKVQPLQLRYYDSAEVFLCADTITFLLNKFMCYAGSVAESRGGGDSPFPLQIVQTHSGEVFISFVLEERANVRLWLADMNGNEVLRPAEGQVVEGGPHKAAFAAEKIPSGTYLCILQAGEKRESRLVRIVR